MKNILSRETIEQKIYIIRDQKVMLDEDLAVLYGVTTFNLNKAVKRNLERFPQDFMFQLSQKEFEALRFQIGISKIRRGGRRYRPYAFTEQGIAMLSSVLRTKRAVLVNITIMRTFVKLRKIVMSQHDLARKLDELEKKCDAQFKIVFDAIRQLMIPPEKSRKRIGFYKE